MWPDGLVTPLVLADRGVHLAIGPEPGDPADWRLLAAPRTPLARDVALSTTGFGGHLAWSDENGVHVARLDRGDPRQPSRPDPEHLRRIGGPETGEAHFPVATLSSPDGTLDVIWTNDRRRLVRVTDRPGFPLSDPVELPRCCAPGERLRGLATAVESDKTAWLACATDRGRLLVARWDLRYDVHSPWQPVRLPVPAAGMVAAACVGDRPVVVMVTRTGAIWECDARAAEEDGDPAWQNIEPPTAVDGLRIQAVAAADHDGTAWLAAASGRRIWCARLVDGGRRVSVENGTETIFDV